MLLDNDLYMGLKRVLERGSARILEDDEDGLFIQDEVSKIFLLACLNKEKAISWIKQHDEGTYRTFQVFDLEIVAFLKEQYGFKEMLDCYQVVYHGTMFEEECKMVLRKATIADFEFISTYYHKISEEELKGDLKAGLLWLGLVDEKVIGFIGEHSEGSMGLLYVLEEERGKGYGKMLEKLMINDLLARNIIPFGQVETHNKTSLSLQKSLGLTASREHLYWIF